MFDLLDTIVYNIRQPVKLLSRVLGVPLVHRPEKSNEVSTVYEARGSTASPLVRSVTVRMTNPGEEQESLIAVVLDIATCITEDVVAARYGRDFELDVPTPRQPPSAPLCHAYRSGWGALNFAFSRQGAKCLQMIRVEIAVPGEAEWH